MVAGTPVSYIARHIWKSGRLMPGVAVGGADPGEVVEFGPQKGAWHLFSWGDCYNDWGRGTADNLGGSGEPGSEAGRGEMGKIWGDYGIGGFVDSGTLWIWWFLFFFFWFRWRGFVWRTLGGSQLRVRAMRLDFWATILWGPIK